MTVVSFARMGLKLAIVLGAGTLIGFLLLVLGFQVGMLAQIDILFYRGLCLIALALPVTFLILAVVLMRGTTPELALHDALSAAIVSAALNVAFLIVVPVTVDRSISIFVLGQMAEHPDEPVTAEGMSALFTRVYVDQGGQIARRLHEQAVSGNLAAVPGGGYRITARGLAVVRASRATAVLFDSHSGILSSSPAPPPQRRH